MRRRLVWLPAMALACSDARSEPSSTTGDTAATTTESGTETAETGAETATETGSDTDDPAPTGELVLETLLDIDAVVTTKGMDVDAAGRVLLWNYNQDQLEVYDGASLEVLADAGLITSFGTDLSVDSTGAAVVSKGGDQLGEQLMKWDGQTGAPLWGPTGLSLPGALLLGLSHAERDGAEVLLVADGGQPDPQIRWLAADDGAAIASTPVTGGVPLDVAAAPDGTLYVLRAPSSNPVGNAEPVELIAIDEAGALLAGPVVLVDAVYLARSTDGVVYVSSTNFAAPTRRILSFGPDLEALATTELPAEYEGFAGGITTVGEGDETRVMISAQAGVGSGPICDVLIYRRP